MHVGIILIVIMTTITNTIIINLSIIINHHNLFVCVLVALGLFKSQRRFQDEALHRSSAGRSLAKRAQGEAFTRTPCSHWQMTSQTAKGAPRSASREPSAA